MIRNIACLVAIGLILSGITAAAGDLEKEAGAVYAAERWLSMVDNAQYAESWESTSELFKNAVRLEQWKQSMQAIRAPLGQIVSRRVSIKTYATSLPGAPDGEYVVIHFDTTFENKKAAVETVTPMMDKDGVWRVSGYYIQ